MTIHFDYQHSKHLQNAEYDAGAYAEFRNLLSQADCVAAYQQISQWPGYASTELIELSDVAAAAGVASVPAVE